MLPCCGFHCGWLGCKGYISCQLGDLYSTRTYLLRSNLKNLLIEGPHTFLGFFVYRSRFFSENITDQKLFLRVEITTGLIRFGIYESLPTVINGVAWVPPMNGLIFIGFTGVKITPKQVE